MRRARSSASNYILGRVGNRKTNRNYVDHEEVFVEGDVADAMFYIESGHVKLSVASNARKRAVLAILGKGDFFGENCLLKHSRRTTTATAIRASTITRVSNRVIRDIMHREPETANLLVPDLLSRIERIQEDFTDRLLNLSERRLARLLLRLSQLGRESKSDTVSLHVSQGTLAEMVGTTRSRVSYFMNRFREKGFIEYNGSLRVHRALHAFLVQK